MPACIIAQKPEVIGQHHGSLSGQQPRAMGLRILDPGGAHLSRFRIARVFIHQHQSVAMCLNACLGRTDRVAQIRHDHVDARGQCLGLPGAQVLGQSVNVRVAIRHLKHCFSRQLANPHQRCIVEIAKALQVVGPLLQIRRGRSDRLVDQAVPDRVQHRLMLPHCIDDRARIRRPFKAQSLGDGHVGQVRKTVQPRQPLGRVRPHMHGAVLVGKEASGHELPQRIAPILGPTAHMSMPIFRRLYV